MFRLMQRKNQAIRREDCLQLLRQEKRGILSVLGDEGYPYGMPLNHWYREEDGKLYFHSGMTGHKIDAIRNYSKVSYCVYDSGFYKEGDWALNIRSVIVFGRVEIVEDHDKALEISRALSYKFTSDEEYIEKEIQFAGHRVLVFALNIEHMSGKLVNEK